jgi:hypothetical protein
MNFFTSLKNFISRFSNDEQGSSTIEFVIVFPVFFGFFLMTVESGIVSIRHVMLEHAIDITVRDVRLGKMPVPTIALLRTKICDEARIIPDCEEMVQIEQFRLDPLNWVNVPTAVQCINRGLDMSAQPTMGFTNGGNNELVLMRVCARFDPLLPTSGLGKAITEVNSGADAAGSYALVSLAAFVVEPFLAVVPGS